MKYALAVILAILALTGISYAISKDQIVIIIGLLSIPGIMAVMPWQLLSDQQAAEHEEEARFQQLLDQAEERDHMVQGIGFTAPLKSPGQDPLKEPSAG